MAEGLRLGKTNMEEILKQKTPIMEDGILHDFLYNNYWLDLKARKAHLLSARNDITKKS